MCTGRPGRAAARVRRPDKMGVFGPGELGLHEIADRLKRRRANGERVALRLNDKLTSPQLRELLGTTGYQGLRGQHARNLAFERVALGTLFNGRSRRPLGVERLLPFLTLNPQGIFNLALGGQQLDLLGPRCLVSTALLCFQLRNRA